MRRPFRWNEDPRLAVAVVSKSVRPMSRWVWLKREVFGGTKEKWPQRKGKVDWCWASYGDLRHLDLMGQAMESLGSA